MLRHLHAGSHVIAGDFNFHIDDTSDSAAVSFLKLLDSCNLRQHVQSPTHRDSHYLDLVISRSDEDILNSISVHDSLMSDHYAVSVNFCFRKPCFEKKTICSRKLKAVDLHQFRHDVGLSALKLSESRCDLLSLVELFKLGTNRYVHCILDKHAPVKLPVVTIRPAAPWYNTEIAGLQNEFVESWKENGVKASYWAIVLDSPSKVVLSISYYTQRGPKIILIL